MLQDSRSERVHGTETWTHRGFWGPNGGWGARSLLRWHSLVRAGCWLFPSPITYPITNFALPNY